VSRLQWSQLGCISREQIERCGVSRTTAWRRLVTGEWARMSLDVFRVTSAPETEEQAPRQCAARGRGRRGLKLWGETVSTDEVPTQCVAVSAPPPR
jgi:hypothetical protein